MADSETTLPVDYQRGIDALIAELASKVRSPGHYTSQEALKFVRRWKDRAGAA